MYDGGFILVEVGGTPSSTTRLINSDSCCRHHFAAPAARAVVDSRSHLGRYLHRSTAIEECLHGSGSWLAFYLIIRNRPANHAHGLPSSSPRCGSGGIGLSQPSDGHSARRNLPALGRLPNNCCAIICSICHD